MLHDSKYTEDRFHTKPMIQIFTSPQQQKGKQAEDIAVMILHDLGHVVFTRNMHTRFGEIDIITLNNNNLYFWEVKSYTRNTEDYEFERISHKKQMRIMRSIEYILNTHVLNNVSYENIRVSAIIIRFSRNISPQKYTYTLLEDINIK